MPDKTTKAQRWLDVPVLIAAFLGLLLCAWPSESRAQGEAVELIFLDVGQGDPIVVRAPEGNVALVDAGRKVSLVELLGANGPSQEER